MATDAWTKYRAVQSLKLSSTAVIDDINYANVIAHYLYDHSIMHCVKFTIFGLLFRTQTTVAKAGGDLLVFYSHRYKRRPDYDYIADTLAAICGSRTEYIESREVFDPRQSWHTFSHITKAWRATSHFPAAVHMRLCAAVLIAKYSSSTRRTYESHLRGKTRVITFCDAAPHDNLIAQLAHNWRIRTLTAQHGQYRVLDRTNMSTDAEAYANFVSDRLLCWGEATRREFEKAGIDRSRMCITGWLRSWENIELPTSPTGRFGVMLNGDNGSESNIELLKIAMEISSELALSYVVRLHPASNGDQYKSYVNERCESLGAVPAREYAGAVDFSVAHMSGATIEMLQVGSPVYAFDDGRLAGAFKAPGLSFTGTGDIIEAIRKDAASSDGGRSRVEKLRHWFNDDSDQHSRILNAILAEEK